MNMVISSHDKACNNCNNMECKYTHARMHTCVCMHVCVCVCVCVCVNLIKCKYV